MRLFGWTKGAKASLTGPTFKSGIRKGEEIWAGQGVLADFNPTHELEILVTDETSEYHQDNFETDWLTDANEVIFRNGKMIKLYWRKK